MQENKPFPLGNSRIVVLGAGSIGVAFAAVFAEAGAQVLIADPDADRLAGVPQALVQQREAIREAGLRRDTFRQIELAASADGHLATAAMVLECGPEDLSIKQDIFGGLLRDAGVQTVLATASSAITISRIVPDEAAQGRCLVAHPVNPPSVLRVIELVPAPGTAPTTTGAARSIFGAAGFSAVTLGHEIEGFVLNRLQGAVLREAYRLVEDGVTDVAGVDAIMRIGLGPRWALSGPFETAELNTPGGIPAHAARMGPAYKRMGEARGETVEWSDKLIAQVAAERAAILPVADIPGRVSWRSRSVAKLILARDALMRGNSND